MHQGLGAYPDYELSKRKCDIGNHPKADLYIEKDTVSSRHAVIDYQDGQYFIEDFNSTNGTYLNEVPVNYKQKMKLSPGDEIRFADVRYRFL
jgi:pSer/pThr/pTyr-binding forkhead associated (FHA) protein